MKAEMLDSIVKPPKKKAKISNKELLAFYQHAINQIDDYFEYTYDGFGREEIREHVMGIIDDLTRKIGEEASDGKG